MVYGNIVFIREVNHLHLIIVLMPINSIIHLKVDCVLSTCISTLY